MQKISLRAAVLIGLGVTAIGAVRSQQNIPGHLTAADLRYVALPEAAIWIRHAQGLAYGGVLPQFSNVRVLGPSPDPKFLIAETGAARTVTIAAAALAPGDGDRAKARWCEQLSRNEKPRNEIMERLARGPHQVTIKNLGDDADAVVKFRGLDGTVVLSIFVAAGSNAFVSDFPDGRFRLQFATGREWSRRSQAFRCDMGRPQQFQNFDQFYSTGTQYRVAEYTITPVRDGNVHTEPLDAGAFASNSHR